MRALRSWRRRCNAFPAGESSSFAWQEVAPCACRVINVAFLSRYVDALSAPRSSRGAASIVAVVSLLGKAVGYVRVVLIAYFFGASAGVDAFYVAWGAVVFFTALAKSAVDMSLLPELSRADGEETGSGKSLVAAVWWFAAIFSLVGAIGGMIAPGVVIRLFALGFDAERIRIGAVMILCLIPFGVAAFLRPVVDAWQLHRGRVAIPGVVEALFNIVTIPVFLGGIFFWGVFSLPVSMSVGNVSLLLLSLLIVGDFPLRPGAIPWRSVKMVMKAAGVAVAVAGISGLYQVTDRFFASTLEEGSVAALSYAEVVFSLPNAVLLPVLLIYYAKICAFSANRQGRMEVATKQTLAIAWGYFIPVGMCFVALGRPLVSLWFGYGALGKDAVDLTGLCLTLYALCLPLSVVLSVLQRYLLAGQLLGKIVLLNVLGVLLNAFFDWLLAPRFGAPGIAMATTCVLFSVVAVFHFYAFPAGLDKVTVRFVAVQTLIALAWGIPLFVWGLRSELLPCIAGMASLALHLFYGDARGLFEILPEQWRPLEVLRFLVTRVRSGVSVFRKTQGE